MTIREFISTLHALAPHDEVTLIEKFGMTQAEAEESLAHSWLVRLNSEALPEVLDDPDPSPHNMIACCVLPVTIENIHLFDEVSHFGNYISFGHMHQQYLVYDCIEGSVGAVDYEMDMNEVMPVASSYRQFLDALSVYAEYSTAFSPNESPLSSNWNSKTLLVKTIEASGVGAEDKIWWNVYRSTDLPGPDVI